jgi:hypothetical protein
VRAFAVAVLVALCCACAGEEQVTGDRRNIGVFTIVFTVTPARVRIGQSVRFTIRVSNNGGKTEKLDSPSGKLYDFWVKKGNEEVWRWSDDRAFVQTVTETQIPTQSTKTFTETWEPTETGAFTAYGELTAEGLTGPLKGSVDIR